MNYSSNILWIRRLLWAYFCLLIFEGVLRKWVLPGLSNPLLLVRVPIVIGIYALAIKSHIFPYNKWVICCCLLAFSALFAGLYVLQDAPVVALFGFQSDFLQLPLIFLFPRVFDYTDVRKIGYWTLIFSIPMMLLMVLQFEAPPSAWINTGAGEGSGQISAALGHIRPAGTFSYITGPEAFFPLVAAFLLISQFVNWRFPRWLLMASAIALIVGTGVSSSRGLAVSVGIVLLSALIIGTILQPVMLSQKVIMRTVQGLIALCIAGLVVMHVPVFNEGLATFSSRIDSASGAEGGSSGFVNRGTSQFTDPLSLISDTPPLGKGLGLGTNAGAALVNSAGQYLLAEGEWARVILESGPVLGVAYLVLRVALLISLTRASFRLARKGNVLPLLLISSCAPLVLGGQFGQPTELGFAVLGSGLTFAAMRLSPASEAGAINIFQPAHGTSPELAS